MKRYIQLYIILKHIEICKTFMSSCLRRTASHTVIVQVFASIFAKMFENMFIKHVRKHVREHVRVHVAASQVAVSRVTVRKYEFKDI